MSIKLFEPYRIGRLELRNRLVRSATWDATADSFGAVTDSSIAIYQELARGGVGLIVTGHAFVSPLGQAGVGQYGIHTNDMIPGLRRLVEAAHEGGAKIALQVTHGGINSRYLQQTGMVALAVSGKKDVGRPHQEMTDEEIEAIISDFASAAARAAEAGCDAVQLHGAHGYLLSQFLSPLYNQRTDRWGDSGENRRRFHLEVIRRVRQTVGIDFPLMIKFGVQDDKEGGLSLDEGLETARQMEVNGINAIEVSSGVGGTAIQLRRAGDPERAYFRERAAAVKRAVTVPVMVVGGIRSLEMARDILDSGDADLISMCRPFIREPDLVARWQRRENSAARCISCNKCLPSAKRDELECGEERRLREEIAASI